MAKTRRNSVENMFAKKGSVQPQKKDVVKEEPQIQETKDIEKVAVKEAEETLEDISPIEFIAEEKKEEIVEEPPKKEDSKEIAPASIDNLFNKQKKKGRGKALSIYFTKEVYDFCSDIAERYELGMSDVVNKLITSIIED